MPFEPNTLLLITAIAFVAYTLFALSGFGSNLVTVPLLGLLYPLTYVLPMLATLDFAAALRIGFQSRGHLLRRELVWLLPSLGIGIIAGTTLLINLPPTIVLGALGGLILAYGIFSFADRPLRLRLPQWAALPCGIAGGVLSSLFGTGGPVYVTYLAARGHDPREVRSTITVLLSVTSFARIGLYLLYGLYAQDNVLLYALAAAPAMLLGVYLGHHLHLNLPKRRLVQCMALLLVASGCSLLLRALH
jgi:uncharacterized membrane protein YfcA